MSIDQKTNVNQLTCKRFIARFEAKNLQLHTLNHRKHTEVTFLMLIGHKKGVIDWRAHVSVVRQLTLRKKKTNKKTKLI